jgi:hypothetical protein
MTRQRRLFFAKLTRREQRVWDHSFGDDLRAALDPDNVVTRYDRSWRVSQTVTGDGFIAGKFGFVGASEAESGYYDELVHDFVVAQVQREQAPFSHFVVDLATEILAFEERPPEIRLQSFVGAFSKLVAEASPPFEIDVLTDPETYQAWADSVDRVKSLKAVLSRPNPGYVDTVEVLERALEEAEATTVELLAKSSATDDGLNKDTPWFVGALDQVSSHGQGKLIATGTRNSVTVRWESQRRTKVEILAAPPADDRQLWQELVDRIRRNFRR